MGGHSVGSYCCREIGVLGLTILCTGEKLSESGGKVVSTCIFAWGIGTVHVERVVIGKEVMTSRCLDDLSTHSSNSLQHLMHRQTCERCRLRLLHLGPSIWISGPLLLLLLLLLSVALALQRDASGRVCIT